MMVASRKFYEPTFKVRVLDEVREAGAVPTVARKHRLEPSLVYGWKASEADIRKAARKQEKQEAKDAAAEQKQSGKVVALPKPGLAKIPVVAEALHPDGPTVSVHALGPWLKEVVREALPAALQPELDAVLERRLADIESRLSDIIRRVLKEGVG